MKRAVISLIGIMVLCGMPLPADAQNKRPPLPNGPMLEGALIIGHIDDAYRQFWGSSTPEIQSKNCTAREIAEGKELIFLENVKAYRGDTTLACDKLVMLVTASRRYFTASGNVTILQSGRSVYGGKTHKLFLQE